MVRKHARDVTRRGLTCPAGGVSSLGSIAEQTVSAGRSEAFTVPYTSADIWMAVSRPNRTYHSTSKVRRTMNDVGGWVPVYA